MNERDLRLRALELAVQSVPPPHYGGYEILTRARVYEAYVKTGLIPGDEPKPPSQQRDPDIARIDTTPLKSTAAP